MTHTFPKRRSADLEPCSAASRYRRRGSRRPAVTRPSPGSDAAGLDSDIVSSTSLGGNGKETVDGRVEARSAFRESWLLWRACGDRRGDARRFGPGSRRRHDRRSGPDGASRDPFPPCPSLLPCRPPDLSLLPTPAFY